MTSLSTETSELARYQPILSDTHGKHHNGSHMSSQEERIAPIMWWNVKEHLDQQQYAVLGHVPEELNSPTHPVLLNTNAPWSAFLCGSQGSGKSHALSCMLENCLLDDPRIGKNPNQLAGLVFHYDRTQGIDVCEAAYLCSQVKTRVLVSPSNYGRMKARYENMAQKQGGNIDVQRLLLVPNKHLDTARMKTLMATGKEGEMPLYMHVLIKILCDIASANDGSGKFDYKRFRKMIREKKDAKELVDKQTGPLDLRLALLDSFLNLSAHASSEDYIAGQPGQLTIIDLTDPVIDSDAACVLFDICLSIFVSQTRCSKIVALDEAHNYMAETSSNAVKEFTEKLLKTIREQRHQATRVVIATQEPSINTQLIDLCNITMVHRCTSPAWYAVLKHHIAALYAQSMRREEGRADLTDRELFDKIVTLRVGESLLFCTTAAVDIVDGRVIRLDAGWRRFKTRIVSWGWRRLRITPASSRHTAPPRYSPRRAQLRA